MVNNTDDVPIGRRGVSFAEIRLMFVVILFSKGSLNFVTMSLRIKEQPAPVSSKANNDFGYGFIITRIILRGCEFSKWL